MRKLLSFLVGLVVIAALSFGAYRVFCFVGAVLQKLDPSVQGPLVVASLTALGSVFTLATGRWLENRATVHKELRARKAEVYEHLIRGIFRLTFGEKLNKPMSELERNEYFVQAVENLTIWGSSDVVDKFGTFKQNATPTFVLVRIEELLIAIRQDLGHSQLQKGKVMRMFINDYETALAPLLRKGS